MTRNAEYISVAISLQNAAGTETTVSYNNASTLALPAIEGIAQEFENLKEGYMIWRNGDKRAFTYFRFNDLTMQREMQVTVMMGDDILVAGRPILNLLGSIRSRITEGETLDEDKIAHIISESGFVEEPLKSECDRDIPAQVGVIGCRMYSSAGELANIFGFPRQEAYGKFGCILVLPVISGIKANSSIEIISTPIDRALMVVCPEGVKASAYKVEFSDHLTVTYSCEGFDAVSVMFEVGTTNRYVRINGPALVVNTAHHAGIEFHKRIPYSVTSTGGYPIDTYTILINDRTATRTAEGFEVANTDFVSGSATITISSTNFSSFVKAYTPEELEAAAPIDIVLLPESRSVLLRLDFGDGRVVEESLSIEKNTPEYCQLRAGRFHGFRAYRVVGSDPETYNVDVRYTAPVSNVPTDETEDVADSDGVVEIDETISTSPVAPIVEIADSAKRKEYKSERKAPEFINETRGEKAKKSKKPTISKRWIMAGICVVAVILILWLVGGKGSGKTVAKTSNDSISETTAQMATASSPEEQALEQADLEYLNKNNTWKKSEIKSQLYKTLIEAMVSADVDAMANHPYFKKKGLCTTKYAGEIMGFVWEAKGTPHQLQQAKVLKVYKDKDDIDIYKLWKDLSRHQPKDEIKNKDSRPQE